MSKKKEKEIWAEMLNMKPQTIKLDQIYLDPNNPRLAFPDKEIISDDRIAETEIQLHYMQQMRDKIGITDLTESIRTSGFSTVDRVVLRPLNSRKFVVVEGNRRIAALKTLISAHKKGNIELPKEIKKRIEKFEALVYTGYNSGIAWIIQGFRHTPGIKPWERYPKAKFLADFKEDSKKTFAKIASIFGMNRGDVTHLIRSFFAFEQAKDDEDYGDILEPEKFGHFDEIILKVGDLKKWMDWDEKQMKFKELNNLKKYLSWATARDGEKPKIDISATTRKTIPKLIKSENSKLLEKFESGEYDINLCADELLKEETKREILNISDILKNLQETKNLIMTLPIPQLQLAKSKDDKDQKDQLYDLLTDIVKIAKRQLKNLSS